MNPATRMQPYFYADDLLVFLAHSDQTSVCSNTMSRFLRKRVQDISRVMDVGCGDGTVTASLIELLSDRSIKEVVLLEPDTGLLNLAKTRLQTSILMREGFAIKTVSKSVEAAIKGIDYAPGLNVIVSSQALYYFKD